MLPMTTVTCRICGTDFDIREGETRRDCPACGTEASRPKVVGEPLTSLRRAHQQRAACDFVNASVSYQSVLLNRPDEAEALWGLTLCKYGVEYVEDEKTHRRHPVVHFLQRRPITEDPDFLLACQNAPEADHAQYAADARYISRIQQGVMEAQATQQGWDVFLCYKASIPGSGDSAAKTAEYGYAKDLFFRLSMEGYRVFFAHETLSKVAGADYEAQIFYALQSAKVMLVVCANASYLTTPWVHSEWSRFLSRVDDRDDCRLVPLLYDNCNPYALPEAFRTRRLQGLRMGEFASADNLRQVLAEQIRPAAVRPGHGARPDAEIHSALLRISMLLEDGDWTRAESRAQELIDQAPDCSEAHLSLLLARHHLPDADALASCPDPFGEELPWKRALRFASPQEKTRLTRLAQEAHDRIHRQADEQALQQLLDSRRWPQALEAAVAFSQRYPDSAFGSCCLLLSQLELPSPEALATCTEAFEELPAWAQLLSLSTRRDREQLEDLLAHSLHLRRKQAQQKLISALSGIHLQRHLHMEARARELLQAGQWNAAAATARTLLLSGLRRDDALLLELLAALQAASLEELATYPAPFEQTTAWQTAMNGGSPSLRQTLRDVAQKHQNRLQQAAREQAEQSQLAHAYTERERLIRERAERRAQAKSAPAAAAAPGRVVFRRGKERLLGATGLTIYVGNSTTPYATLTAGSEVTVTCPEPTRVCVKTYPDTVVWNEVIKPGMDLRVDVRWPLFGSPKFTVQS